MYENVNIPSFATFSIVILIITAVLTQISMALKVVVYLSERRDNRKRFSANDYLASVETKPDGDQAQPGMIFQNQSFPFVYYFLREGRYCNLNVTSASSYNANSKGSSAD